MAVRNRAEFAQITLAIHQCRDETVLVIEEGQFQIGLAPECLQPASGIVAIVAQQPLANAIADARGEFLPGAVLAVRRAVATDKGKPLWRIGPRQGVDHRGQVLRRVLAVPVQGCDDRTARDADAPTSRRKPLCGFARHLGANAQ